MTQGQRIAASLRHAWNGTPWHGPSAAAILGRLGARQASTRRARGSHTAWQLLLHLTVWAETPLRRLDDPTFDPPLDFPEPSEMSDAQWTADVGRLGGAIEQLALRSESLADDVLAAPVGARGYTVATMLDGVAQHVAYHAGQIAVLALTEEVAGVVMPPPLIVLGAMAIAEGLRRTIEWPMPGSLIGGLAIAATGVGLVFWAHEYFVKHRTPAAPWRASRALISGGPYRFSRNPMYVGGLLVQAGAGIARHNAWYLVLLVPAWAALHWGVVRREERYLLKKFGAPYQQFLDTTRRWLV
jgi:protein-S-isoprenylcysteine O-methyltransferase Ste14